MSTSSLAKLDLATFVAAKHAPTDLEWSELVAAFAEEGESAPAREACLLYAEGFLVEQRADGFYPHAWWYAPVKHETLESAEIDLHKWRQEFE